LTGIFIEELFKNFLKIWQAVNKQLGGILIFKFPEEL
jgi:hypothetical protein